jgi:hypothetical protein
MLYTVIPLEEIYKDKNEDLDYQYEEVSLKNSTLELYPVDKGYKVKRIISTNPRDYLNNAIQPDTMITETQLSALKLEEK